MAAVFGCGGGNGCCGGDTVGGIPTGSVGTGHIGWIVAVPSLLVKQEVALTLCVLRAPLLAPVVAGAILGVRHL